MALSFKNNGEMWMWSPWANLANIEAFKQSLEIPVPSGKTVQLSDSGEDISELVDIIMTNWNKNENGQYKYNSNNMFSNYNDENYIGLHPYILQLLLKVNDSDKVQISKEIIDKFGNDNIQKIIFDRIINKHTLYFSNLQPDSPFDSSKPTTKDISNIFKNIVTLSLMNVITDIRNLGAAMSPVSMGEAGEAADQSQLGQNAKTRIDMNPTTVAETTEEFLTGKSGIGIAANGVKVNFSLLFHFIKAIKGDSRKKLASLPFDVTLNINGQQKYFSTFSGLNENALTDAELEKIKEITELYLRKKGISEENIQNTLQNLLTNGNDQSIALSALLSAATDNAKELILKKINADESYMNLYIFGIVLGMTIPEISSIMTSKEVSYIIRKSKDNLFTGYGIKDTFICNQLLYGANLYELNNYSINVLLQKLNLTKKDDLYALISEQYQNKTQPFSSELVAELEQDSKFDIQTFKKFLNLQKELLENTSNNTKEIIENFQTLKKGGTELTNLAKLLSINQGISPVPGDLINQIVSYENIVNTMLQRINSNKLERKLTDLYSLRGEADAKTKIAQTIEFYENVKNKFSLIDFLNPRNQAYRENMLDILDCCKIMVNPFRVILEIPHINQSFADMFKGITSIRNLTQRFDLLYNIRKQLSINKNLDNKQWSNINNIIDSQIIYNWISKQYITFPVKQGDMVIQGDKIISMTNDDNLELGTFDGLTTFKYWVENTLLKVIQNPDLYPEIDSKTAKILRENGLIRDLEISSFRDSYSGVNVQAILLPNMNFMNVDEPGIDQDKYNQYLQEIRKLENIEVFGRKLIDWFFLYNLIVFKNKPRMNNINVLFKPFLTVSQPENNLVSKYYYDQGNLDWNKDSLLQMLSIDDFERAIAPVASRRSLRTKKISEYKYVRIFDQEKGGYILYRNGGNRNIISQYIEPDDLPNSYLSGYSLDTVLNGYVESNYRLLKIKDYYEGLSSYIITTTQPVEEMYSTFINLLRQGILNIKTEC